MPGLPLLDLPPTLLERIITKFEERSYFRAQQTCRTVYELIRSSRNISIFLDEITISDIFADDGFAHVLPSWRLIKFDELYGTRLSSILLNEEPEDYNADFCRRLERNRITSVKLYIQNPVRRRRVMAWSRDQCAAVVNALKPTFVSLDGGRGSKGFEALFELKTLKTVRLVVDTDDHAISAIQLLSTCQQVEINAALDSLDILRRVILLLRSQPLPNLRKLRFELRWTERRGLSLAEEIPKVLGDCNLTFGMTSASIAIPQDFPGKPICNLTISPCELTYEKEEVALPVA